MMNQQPDKFFRDKLHGYQQPVSSGAWNRVSENIARRNRRVLWLRVAASVLLLATSGIFIYPALQKNAADNVAHNKTLPKVQRKGDLSPATANQPSINRGQTHDNSHIVVADTIQPGQAVKQRHGRTQMAQKNSRTLPKEQHPSPHPAVERALAANDNENLTARNDAMVNSGRNEMKTGVMEQQPLKGESITKAENVRIVFTAEEVNEKYLTKISDTEATPEAKETSGFKRLLDKAYDLKNNQNLMGDLRQRKNEILAMNFKNEKEHTEDD